MSSVRLRGRGKPQGSTVRAHTRRAEGLVAFVIRLFRYNVADVAQFGELNVLAVSVVEMSKDKSKDKNSERDQWVGMWMVLACISLVVTGLAASLVARDHHNSVATTHLTIAPILLPFGCFPPIPAICWLGALITLVSVPASRHILAAQLANIPSNGTSIGNAIVEKFDSRGSTGSGGTGVGTWANSGRDRDTDNVKLYE
ncbi:hypothetical protein BGZ57DRAFT_1009024 [Hyaloscypha finlandica]|nr:hypothetical protein BGZ57DRAFT_1009024 [Hyaloscypha finlandica]